MPYGICGTAASCDVRREAGKADIIFFPGSAQIENQDIFTHLWGYKNILKFNYKEREAFNRKMYDRIVREFPEEETTLKQLPISGL